MSRTDRPTDELSSDDDDSFLREVAGMDPNTPPVALTPGLVVDAAYRIERELGSGGMGTVYLAFDLRLRRNVAIKVHQRADATERLRREAASMARLIHPNVVTVYEIGEFDGHPFVAMEYVDGGTARGWLAERPRTWREIVGFYLSAARGLAAAHAAGLVHRDFKPDNVLVGKDGRIRVADFGLAQPAGLTQPRAAIAAADEIVYTGSAAGTPGYMAPEQYDGGEVGPAADQYAFCVALWEALSGTRPSGATATTEVGATGPATPHLVRAPEVPAWLEPVIARGLRVDPAERWPSMDALIAALSADPGAVRRRRLRIAAVAVAIVAPAALLVALVPSGHDDPAAMCARARDHTAGVWDDARRAEVRRAFETSGRVDAAATFERVAAALDRRTTSWVDARIDACRATHVRGEQSAQLLDLRMRCLDRRLADVRALVDVLAAGDAGIVDHAVEAAESLRPLDGCADVDALTREIPLPDDPAVRARISTLDQRAAAIEARIAAGRYRETLQLAERLAKDAAAAPYPPLRARIELARARLVAEVGHHADAERAYFDALDAASAARDDGLALDAWRGVIGVRIADSRMVGADILAEGAIAAAARLDDADPGRGDLEVTLAELRGKQTRFADALEHARAGRAWFAAHAPGTLGEASSLFALADAQEVNGKYDDALATNAAGLALLAPVLGADHPEVATRREDRSRLLVELSRFDDALAELHGLVAPVERAYGADGVERGRLALAIADAERQRGHDAEAVAEYQRALGIYRATGTDVEVARALVGLGAVAMNAGRLIDARDQLTEAAAVAERALPESELLLSGILVYLGGAVASLGDIAEGQRQLLRALEIRTRLFGDDSAMVGEVENTIGQNYTWLGDHAAAVAHLERAIEIDEAALGPASLDALFAHANLGTELLDQGKYADAVSHHEHALAGLEKMLGPDHPVLCAPLSVLAYAYAMTGRAREGVAAGERCHAIRVARGEPDGAHLALGRGAAMWEAGGDRRRARALVKAAVAELREFPDDPAALPRAEAWLAAHPGP